MGPRAGPINAATENKMMALPLSTGSHISPSTPGALESAELANMLERKRPTIKPEKLRVRAQKKLKSKYRENDM